MVFEQKREALAELDDETGSELPREIDFDETDVAANEATGWGGAGFGHPALAAEVGYAAAVILKLPDDAGLLFVGVASTRHAAIVAMRWRQPRLFKRRTLGGLRLNGKALGIVWCAPWKIRVSPGIVKDGDNQLEIDIINVWPNRMIGDERLPDDCEWQKSGWIVPTKWPDWFENGLPQTSGRKAFSTTKHWTKESPLLTSGLLGPVRVMIQEGTVPDAVYDAIPAGSAVAPAYTRPMDGDLVKGPGEGMFLIRKGKRCRIPSGDVFNANGFNWENVRKITDATLTNIPVGPGVTAP